MRDETSHTRELKIFESEIILLSLLPSYEFIQIHFIFKKCTLFSLEDTQTHVSSGNR